MGHHQSTVGSAVRMSPKDYAGTRGTMLFRGGVPIAGASLGSAFEVGMVAEDIIVDEFFGSCGVMGGTDAAIKLLYTPPGTDTTSSTSGDLVASAGIEVGVGPLKVGSNNGGVEDQKMSVAGGEKNRVPAGSTLWLIGSGTLSTLAGFVGGIQYRTSSG